MEAFVFGAVVPHPPIIIPAVGGDNLSKVEQTVRAMRELAGRLKDSGPRTLIFITPHGEVYRDVISVGISPRLRGDMAAFGAPEVAVEYENDQGLARALLRECEAAGVPAVGVEVDELDHGISVPLYYFQQAGVDCQVVPVGMGFLGRQELYRFGACVRRAAEDLMVRTAVVASGDLSHRLLPDAPAGYDPAGKEFDRQLVERLKAGDVRGILDMDEELVERAGECGFRPIIMLLGLFEGLDFEAEVLSYEGPFGVGYVVAHLRPESQRREESWPVRLARETLEAFVRTGEVPPPPKDVPEEFRKPRGVFVSIKSGGQLRGCIGTVEPTTDSAAEEIIRNAIEAGTRDPRFPPVREEELGGLRYSVDLLEPEEPVDGPEDLDPKKYGVIVRKGWRTGLLLPNLEGVDTAEEQLEIAMQKAGIMPGEEGVRISRFTVTRYT